MSPMVTSHPWWGISTLVYQCGLMCLLTQAVRRTYRRLGLARKLMEQVNSRIFVLVLSSIDVPLSLQASRSMVECFGAKYVSLHVRVRWERMHCNMVQNWTTTVVPQPYACFYQYSSVAREVGLCIWSIIRHWVPLSQLIFGKNGTHITRTCTKCKCVPYTLVHTGRQVCWFLTKDVMWPWGTSSGSSSLWATH